MRNVIDQIDSSLSDERNKDTIVQTNDLLFFGLMIDLLQLIHDGDVGRKLLVVSNPTWVALVMCRY